MANAPCAGCPPCCPACIFGAKAAKAPATTKTVLSKEAYGCIKPDAGALVLGDGMLGMMRGDNFHPVTQQGVEFLHTSGNELSAYCS